MISELEIERISVKENGIIGKLFVPKVDCKLPGVVVLPGSDGGIPEGLASRIAQLGYVVFSLAYFSVDDLPEYIENIPLEYFETAINWFKTHAYVRKDAIALAGYSRGGELVLLLGAFFPHLMKSIVAYVPSSFINGGFPHPNRPAWTYHNKPLMPHVKGLSSSNYDLTEREDLIAVQGGANEKDFDCRDNPCVIKTLFESRIRANPELMQTAFLPVDKIKASLLILTGQDDMIWPSSFYGDLIMENLERNGSKIFRKHIAYPNAGHNFFSKHNMLTVYHPVGKFWCKMGGTKDGNEAAYLDSMLVLEKFLKDTLLSDGVKLDAS